MIVVKLEMWPLGDQSKAREIGRTYIANVGGTAERGNYVAAVCRKGDTLVPKEIYQGDVPLRLPEHPNACRSGEVHDYPRLSYNVWRLIIRALKKCFPEEG